MRINDLIVNNWYNWTDPDESRGSCIVKFLGASDWPDAANVVDGDGNPFTVLAMELSAIDVKDALSTHAANLDKLTFVPMYWFKSLYNLRVSKTGFVMMDSTSASPIDYDVTVNMTVRFDLRTVSRLELHTPALVNTGGDERMVPSAPTIYIEYQGGSVRLSPSNPEIAQHLYNVLDRLYLWVAGFLVKPGVSEYPSSVSIPE